MRRLTKPCLVLLCLCVVGLCRLSAQSRDESEVLMELFERRFETLDSIIQYGKEEKIGFSVDSNRDSIVYIPVTDSVFEVALSKKVEAEIRAFKSRTGLSLSGQAYYRFVDVFDWDDEDGGVSYNGKIQAELKWSIFQSSLIKRKGKINAIRLQGEIERLGYEKERLGRDLIRQKEQSREMYDRKMSGLLTHRIYNLNLLSWGYDYLLRNDYISSDDLLGILNEKAEAERKLLGLGTRDSVDEELASPVSYIVKVDTARFLKHVREQQGGTQRLNLQIALLEQQESNTTYWEDMDISPFVRYAYYIRPEVSDLSNVDVGVTLKFPLSIQSKREKESLRAKRDLLIAESSHSVQQVYEEILFIIEDINRLNFSIQGEYRRCLELQHYLDMRKEAYKSHIGEYNRFVRMKEYNSYLACLEKLVEFEYQRDCQIASLSRYLNQEPIEMFCYTEKIVQNKR